MRVALAMCFIMCLIPTAAIASGDAALIGGTSWLAWALGLLCGIALMVVTTVDWRRLPELALRWLQGQRRNAGWAALGAASLAVLMFY